MNSKEEKLWEETDEVPQLDSSSCQLLRNACQQLQQQIPQAQLQRISPTALAYLGDAVYELYVRMFYLLPPQRQETYHHLVVSQVRAETQAQVMRSLTPHLQDHELEIVRRGRNAASGRPKRVNAEIYQLSTSLETLIGYLYLSDYQRLTELLQKLQL